MRLHRHDEIKDAIARGLCQEKCAFRGEPPCWKMVEAGERVMFPPPTCDEPGCFAEATAALDALLEAVVRLKVGELKEAPPDGKWTTDPLFRHIILRMEPKP
jgi:hypothetical protein